MAYLLAFGTLACVWSFLTILGGERQRKLNEITVTQAASSNKKN